MSASSDIKEMVARAAQDVKAVSHRVGYLEKSLGYLTQGVSTVRTNKDSTGLYCTITYTRSDSTVMAVSVLEHDPIVPVVNGHYNKRTINMYNKAGDTIVETFVYQLQYDTDGMLVSETLM